MTDNSPAGILDVTTHYFEFIPKRRPIVRADGPCAHEVQEGGRYFILLTTSYGLYRYHIHDLVRVTGFHNRTPLIEFLSKGSHFSNLTGEKLSEYQVTHAMADVLAELSLTLNTYSVAPCWNDEQPYYGLFLERGDLPDATVGDRLTTRLEKRLCETNVEYAAKRESLRLGPMRLEAVRNGFWAQWTANGCSATAARWINTSIPALSTTAICFGKPLANLRKPLAKIPVISGFFVRYRQASGDSERKDMIQRGRRKQAE